ncbi:hypothetical protein B7P43_G04761 [Cryptotermes secundus]|uniref:Reverse transcriptase domain-containing protein n=1 Tax=Cryptotermes secundus TaxID=105785 RepID=A0A2J7Q4U5_9NEOP|nr:hypothetical protein B7P43_G04761 [Cryptotermes secundus]
MLLEQLDSYKLDITAIQELKWLGKGVMEKRDHARRRVTCLEQVLLTCRLRIKGKFFTSRLKSHRICRLRIKGKFFNYSLICAHAPTEYKSDEENDSFYDELDEIYGECPKRDCKIIIGDMNAKVWNEDVYRSVIGKHSLHNKSNDNGIRLINFASSEARRKEKRLHKKKKREYDKQELIELEHLRSSNEIRAFYQTLNKSRKDFQPRTTLCRDKEGTILSSDEAILERWAQYFEELLNSNSSEQVEGMTIDRNQGNFDAEEPAPTIKEVEEAIKKLKNNKAPGMDLITAELVKFAGPEYARHLHQLIVKIWITEIIPEEWNLSTVCPIHKNCDVMVCSNYRGISLLCIAYQKFSNILFNRLSPFVEDITGDYQCEFRQGRSTNDQIFTIRQVLEKCNEFQIETHYLFIDFRSAYDSIDRDSLFLAMEEMHIPRKLIALLRAPMRKNQYQIKFQNILSSPIITRNGVRQGDSLACLLFDITLEEVVRDAGINTKGTIFYKSVQILAFADDIDMIGRTHKSMKEAFLNME